VLFRSLIERAGVPGLKRKPGVPALLVRLQEETEVIHLEALRAALVTGLEPRDSAPHLSKFDLFGIAPERCPRRVVGDPGAGPLIVVHWRSEEHTSELQSRSDIVCRLLL